MHTPAGGCRADLVCLPESCLSYLLDSKTPDTERERGHQEEVVRVSESHYDTTHEEPSLCSLPAWIRQGAGPQNTAFTTDPQVYGLSPVFSLYSEPTLQVSSTEGRNNITHSNYNVLGNNLQTL